MTTRYCMYAIFLLVFGLTSISFARTTERVSVASDGTEANNGSSYSSLSADGRYVAFGSEASDLVAGDTNGGEDVFVHDRQTGQTERVSVASDGTQGTYSWWCWPSLSADGRYVTFGSEASGLVADDTNGGYDIFVHDRQTGQTERVSVASDGTQGSYSDLCWPSVSADGRYVSFMSEASDLVAGDTNDAYDIFVHDRQTGLTERVSVTGDGGQDNGKDWWPSISADGRYVGFQSHASNLVAGDTNDWPDIFVHDRQTGGVERVSVASEGTQANGSSYSPSISSDGRYVAFMSQATNLVAGDTNDESDIFVHDRQTGTTERVSMASDGTEANGSSYWTSISSDGRWVAFRSHASDLVAGDTNGAYDIFVHDRQTGTTERVSVASDGTQANGLSYSTSISADGRYVAFSSLASNLVAGDTNGANDIFVHDRQTFEDVPVGSWAFYHIEACVTGGVVAGYGDGTYKPANAVTRDQMAVYISRALAGGDENVPEFTGVPTFPDVPEGFWALDHVEYAASQNVVAGYPDGTYHPEYEVTRDQMAVYVARASVAPTGEAALADYIPADPRNFPDVPSDFWSYKHIEYCVENGVVAGYLDGLYHPEIVVTRDQMAVYVARAFGLAR